LIRVVDVAFAAPAKRTLEQLDERQLEFLLLSMQLLDRAGL
jgi:hypothetical protein